jgi:hypothetical protein
MALACLLASIDEDRISPPLGLKRLKDQIGSASPNFPPSNLRFTHDHLANMSY